MNIIKVQKPSVKDLLLLFIPEDKFTYKFFIVYKRHLEVESLKHLHNKYYFYFIHLRFFQKGKRSPKWSFSCFT